MFELFSLKVQYLRTLGVILRSRCVANLYTFIIYYYINLYVICLLYFKCTQHLHFQ